MRKRIIIDPTLCTGCNACVEACSLYNEGLIDLTKSRIYLAHFEDISLSIPVVCLQCEDAPCEAVCPTNAITKDSETGIVKINQEACIGCKACMSACPYGVIKINEYGAAYKCEYCGGDPVCVKVCLPGALKFIDIDNPTNLIKWEEVEKMKEIFAER